MEFVVTIHSRNAHLQPSTVDYASTCALQQAAWNAQMLLL